MGELKSYYIIIIVDLFELSTFNVEIDLYIKICQICKK